MGISTKHTQKTAKPSIIQLSLKSGKYQLLCFPKISSTAHCGFVPSIFLLVQIKLNMGETQTHSHAWAHRKTLLDSGAGCIQEKASVIYWTCTRMHTLHTHGKPLPNPLPLTSEAVWELRPSSDGLSHNRRLAAASLPCSGASGKTSQPASHLWGRLAGLLPGQKTDMKDSTCKGVTLECKPYTPALAHIHTKGRIILLATWKQEAAGRTPGSTTWRQRSSTSEGVWCSSGTQHADGSCLWGREGDYACVFVYVYADEYIWACKRCVLPACCSSVVCN